ncbi:MAG TPA: hypothetical protein VIX73_22625 [Kofleriaceae bacterium]|jgi:hypothetical protein
MNLAEADGNLLGRAIASLPRLAHAPIPLGSHDLGLRAGLSR